MPTTGISASGEAAKLAGSAIAAPPAARPSEFDPRYCDRQVPGGAVEDGNHVSDIKP